ncbi:MAG TPA: hypothetical protein VLM89_04960 [Phycisphaerae bacterium]|nr:hypothetical protein [Phycisphaerae bacterium]
MSRSRFVLPAASALFPLLSGLALLLADEPASRPAAVPSPPASQPSALSEMGVVRAALTQLYIIPRNQPAALPGDSGKRMASRPANNGPPSISVEHDRRIAAAPTSAPANRTINEADTGLRQTSTVYIESIPWYHTGSPISQKEREWADYRYYGGTPSRYGLRSSYGAHDDARAGTYRYGFVEGYDYGRFNAETDQRVLQLMSHASAHLDQGVRFFRQGQYQQAADTFQLSSETDQGDPLSRIYAGHALFALGRYRDAVRHIRRAFELQPRIAYLTYDIRGDYENPAMFDQQLEHLGKALVMAPRDPDRLFMMGYLHYYTGRRAAAWRYFSRTLELDRADTISDRLMRNAQPPDVEADAIIQQQKSK